MTFRLIDGLANIPDECRGCVVTIGNFDGVHVGHQAILRAARQVADAAAAPLAAMTFEPPAGAVLAPDHRLTCILPMDTRHRLLAEAGADAVIAVNTTPEFLAIPAADFIRDVLIARLAVRHVVEGRDFCFGHHRRGNVNTLRAMSAEGGFGVTVVPPVRLVVPGHGNLRISSSLIRQLILAGEVAEAGLCLGRDYTLEGRVVGGEQRGRALQFPTANIEPADVITPSDGIYAARATLDGNTFPAAVSIGSRPTFGRNARAIEANLIGAEGDYYGQWMVLAFIDRLRDTIRFPDAESLREQIAKDVERVRELCR